MGMTRACTVELMTGAKLAADLLSFEADEGKIRLSTPDRVALHSLSLKDVRTIRLGGPITLVRNPDEPGKLADAAAHESGAREFAVYFHDQKTLVGITYGFIKNKAGLFLYLPEGKSRQAIRCFVPAQQIRDLWFGPAMEVTLLANKLLAMKTRSAARGKLGAARKEKPGEPVPHTGFVTPEELKRALVLQESGPAEQLGELLRDAGVITPAQLAEARAAQAADPRRPLGEILIEMGIVTQGRIHRALADKLDIPFVDISEFQLDPPALALLKASMARRYQALPLTQIGEAIIVAIENPVDLDVVHDLQVLTGRSIVAVIANSEDLRHRIAKEYASADADTPEFEALVDSRVAPFQTGARGKDLSQMDVEELASALTPDKAGPNSTKLTESNPRVTENALVRLVNKIIIDAYRQGASDIHIESSSGQANTRIRFRKDGDLEDYLNLPLTYSNALISRVKIMANLDISERRHAQDGKIAFGKIGRTPIELRVAVVPTTNSRENVVLRILGGVEPLPIANLGLSVRDLAELQRMISRSYGLILVCGPTGSGKTTTLHSILHHINRPDIKIWTAEDPVEITQAGLSQVQINSHIGWTFAAAMRAFLRADPDVIMVGEMRDAETTAIGIEASLTGHLVFSTLHTNSAAESVVRLLDLGMDPFNFADALIGILSQRLARTLCAKCKRSHVASESEITELLEEYCDGTNLERSAVRSKWHADFAVGGQLLVHQAVGCDACRGGYKGRLGIYELLSGTPEVKQLVRSRGSVPQVVEAARADGMRSLRQDAIEKVLLGLIDRPAVRAVSS